MWTESKRAQEVTDLIESAPLPILVKGGAITRMWCEVVMWTLHVNARVRVWTGEELHTRVGVSTDFLERHASAESALTPVRLRMVADIEEAIEHRYTNWIGEQIRKVEKIK